MSAGQASGCLLGQGGSVLGEEQLAGLGGGQRDRPRRVPGGGGGPGSRGQLVHFVNRGGW